MDKKRSELNPYLLARRTWNDRYGDYISRAYTWRLTAFAALGIMALSVIGLVVIGSQNKLIPYLVEVDHLGNVRTAKVAKELKQIDTRIIKSQLSQFIINSRSVYVDGNAQKQALENAYAMLGQSDPATNMLNDYYSTHSPFKKAKEETVTVEVSSVLPISKTTWQVEWRETIRDRTGKLKGKKRMKGVLGTKIIPPKEVKDIFRNPVGLFIKDLSWSEQI